MEAPKAWKSELHSIIAQTERNLGIRVHAGAQLAQSASTPSARFRATSRSTYDFYTVDRNALMRQGRYRIEEGLVAPSKANVANIMTRPERLHELIEGLSDDLVLPPIGQKANRKTAWMRDVRARAEARAQE